MWSSMKGIWKLRAEENRIAGWWMFLFIMHLFLMLAVPLGLSGIFFFFFFSWEVLWLSQEKSSQRHQVSRKFWICNAVLLETCWVAEERTNLSLFLPHTWIMELLTNVLACCLKDQTRKVLQGQFCIFLPCSRTTWCLLWRSTRSQWPKSTKLLLFEVLSLGVNMINSKYFQCVVEVPHRCQPVC